MDPNRKLNTLPELMRSLSVNGVDEEGMRVFNQLVADMSNVAIHANGKSKGTFTIEVKMEMDGDRVIMAPIFKTKTPELPLPSALVYARQTGGVSPMSEHQADIFDGARLVTATEETKTVNGE